MPQERRSYSKSFKSQVIAECAKPDTSIANVALPHNLNANLVHKWIRVDAQKNLTLQTAFIPIKTSPPVAMNQTLPATIRIEVPHSKGVIVVSWPAEMQRHTPRSYETCCDDPHRLHLARHRAHGHARWH
ncbi:transposase [Pseudomonas sp. ADAK2 TE3594]